MVTCYWSADTCFDRCQLIITWMSNIEEVRGKPSLLVSVNLLFGGRHLARLHRRRRGRRRRHRGVYALTSNTPSHDNQKKINSWVSFSFL